MSSCARAGARDSSRRRTGVVAIGPIARDSVAWGGGSILRLVGRSSLTVGPSLFTRRASSPSPRCGSGSSSRLARRASMKACWSSAAAVGPLALNSSRFITVHARVSADEHGLSLSNAVKIGTVAHITHTPFVPSIPRILDGELHFVDASVAPCFFW